MARINLPHVSAMSKEEAMEECLGFGSEQEDADWNLLSGSQKASMSTS